jgi:hypothetical protein
MPAPRHTNVFTLALLAFGLACSAKEEGYPRPDVWPRPTDPPPASPVYHDVEEPVPSEEDIARDAREHNEQMAQEIASALATKDAVRRETVFAYLLPELLQVEPQRLVDLHAGLEAGGARDLLRTEMAEQWSTSNPVAAARWMNSLEDDELRAAAMAALTGLAPREPQTALALAAQLGLEKEERFRKLLAPLRAAKPVSTPATSD